MPDKNNETERNDGIDPGASSQLLPLVYEELKTLARQRLAHEKPGQTLQATALVHEAYLRIVGSGAIPTWDNRGHFFAAAAEAMRRILIDQARHKQSKKRGGGAIRIPLEVEISAALPDDFSSTDLIDLDAALREFESVDPERANVVKLHFFAGLSMSETADALGISLTTARRRWIFARAWLFGKIHGN